MELSGFFEVLSFRIKVRKLTAFATRAFKILVVEATTCGVLSHQNQLKIKHFFIAKNEEHKQKRSVSMLVSVVFTVAS